MEKQRANARRAGASASAAPSADGLDEEEREMMREQGHYLMIDSSDDEDDIRFSNRAERLGERIKPDVFFLYWVRDEQSAAYRSSRSKESSFWLIRAYNPEQDSQLAPQERSELPNNAGSMETLATDETFGSSALRNAQEFNAGTTGVRGLGWKVSQSEDGEWTEFIPEADGSAAATLNGVGTAASVVFYEISNLVAVLGEPSADADAEFYWHSQERPGQRRRRTPPSCVRIRKDAHDRYRKRAAQMYMGDVCSDSDASSDSDEEQEANDSMSESSESGSDESDESDERDESGSDSDGERSQAKRRRVHNSAGDDDDDANDTSDISAAAAAAAAPAPTPTNARMRPASAMGTVGGRPRRTTRSTRR